MKANPIIKKIPEIFKIKTTLLFSCCKTKAIFFKKGLRDFRPFSLKNLIQQKAFFLGLNLVKNDCFTQKNLCFLSF